MMLASALSPSQRVQATLSAEPHRKTAGKSVPFPRAKFPPVPDYAALCAALICETFPARSRHQTCIDASRAVGSSPDTFERILSGDTKSPCGNLMLRVMTIRANRDDKPFPIGNGLAIRITMEASQ